MHALMGVHKTKTEDQKPKAFYARFDTESLKIRAKVFPSKQMRNQRGLRFVEKPQ